MTTTTTTPGANWMVPIIGLLAITFTICTAELVISGLLPTLAADLGVDIPTAGLLITGYALGVAIAGPVLSLMTGRVPRKTLLLAILAVFIVGNLLCAIAPNYWMLLAARLVMSACHGLFFGVAVVVAASLAPPDRKTSAVSMIVAGVTIAIIVGVPLGTAIGNNFGWRATFWATAAAGALGSLVVAWLIPAATGSAGVATSSLKAELRAAVRPLVLLCYLNFFLPLVGFYAVLAYLVPLLTDVSSVPLQLIPLVLLATGIASFLGTIIGGRLGDWNADATLIGVPAIVTVLLLALSQTASIPWLAIPLICLIWMVIFPLPALLQTRMLREASDAPTFASTLMNTASQFGIAGGAALGALLITKGWGYSHIPLFGAGFAALGLAGVVVLVRYERRRKPAAA
ncbi:MAG: MFS transporter [Devosia sp.]